MSDCRNVMLIRLEETPPMPLFEIETEAHIIISWADDEAAAKAVVSDAYP